MSYASDLGLKVGSRIKVIEQGGHRSGNYGDGDILELKRDDGSTNPTFRNLTTGDDTCCFTFMNRGDDVTWEHYKEEEDIAKIKFPCCVPTSEIKDQETFDTIFALFIASGANAYEVGWEGNMEYGYKYFGVDYDKDTIFYSYVESYSFDDEEDEVMVYSVAELLGLVPKEEPVASQEAITERLEDNPSVGIDYSVMGSMASTDPLISITQEVKYTVVIKGITFIFTQDELDALAEELLGFTTL